MKNLGAADGESLVDSSPVVQAQRIDIPNGNGIDFINNWFHVQYQSMTPLVISKTILHAPT